MSAYYVEYVTGKPGIEMTPSSFRRPLNNSSGTATASWADIVSAANMKIPTGHEVQAIIYNAGSVAIRCTQDEAATPEKYTIIAPGTQRALTVEPAKALRVRTL